MSVPFFASLIRPLLVFSLGFVATLVHAQAPALIISEINYNPPGTESNTVGDPGYISQTEFIEIKNVGTTSINLTTIGFSIWDDTGLISSFNTNATISAGGRAIFPRILTSFNTRYPGVTATTVTGAITSRSLSNSGERIRLRYKVAGVDTTFFSVTYGTRAPWPSLPDGSGFTLVSADPNGNSDPNDPLNWRVSTNLYGSPGADDPAFPSSPIVINELQTRDDTNLNADSFEIANFSDSPVDIGNWFLSDDNDLLKRFKIPSPTIVPARGFVTFTQAQLGFGLSGAGGDELKLIAADAAGNFTGYKHGAQPGAGVNQRSFNRVLSLDGREFFQPSLTNTIGTTNSGVYVGPVVFSEISYNHSTATVNPAVVRTEYVELENHSSQPVNLYSSDVNITLATEKNWRVKGIYSSTNTDFAFPANVTLAAGEVVLLIPAKSGVLEATNISTFRTANKVPASVTKIYVYYAFNDATGATTGLAPTDGNILSNGGQILELARPERIASVSNTVPPVTTYTVNFLTEDFAAYDDSSDWPQKADGDGPIIAPATTPTYYARSLVRVDPNGFAGDPRSWDNSVANGGTPGYAVYSTTRSVVVNEVLSHSDLTDPTHESRTDFIELHNPTAAPVTVTSWWLTNNLDGLASVYDKRLANAAYVIQTTDPVYEIPATTIPAGGFWAVNGDNDDNTGTVPAAGGFYGRYFSLNSRGDSCYLVGYNSATNTLTGYVHGFNFDAAENPVSFVRYRNAEGREAFLPAQSITTSFTTSSAFPTGAANSAPKVPSVIISEFMYDAPVGGYEFIELYNNGTSTAALYDNYNEIPGNVINVRHNANNGWQISGIDFKFASALGNRPTIAPGEAVIITNAPSAAAFRAYFTGTPVSTRIFTWSTGLLSNQGERIKLQKPDQEDTVNGSVVVPYINVDEVSYLPVAPWPATGFGGGYSLERKNLNYIGDDASNWAASSTIQGTPGVVAGTRNSLSLWNQVNYSESEILAGTNLGAFDDFNGDGFPNILHYLYGISPKTKPLASQLPIFGTTSISSQSYLTLTYREQSGTTDYGLTAQDTADLLSWGTANVVPLSRVALGGGVDLVTVRYASPFPSASKGFLRLKASDK